MIGEKGRFLKKILIQAADRLLNLLYPRCCPLCHEILRDQRALVCPDCGKNLKPVAEPRCMRCGKPVGAEEEFCPECRGGRHEFTQGRGVFLYDEVFRRAIVKYKYGGRRQYGEFFARAMCLYGEKDILRWQPDVVVPVPLHPKKQRARGFNQAAILGELIGEYFGIPFSSELLKKVRSTKSQKKMSAGERRRNLKGAFAVTAPLFGRTVLIIDDVYTTGSTVDEAARALKRAGAGKVYFLALCTGRPEKTDSKKVFS